MNITLLGPDMDLTPRTDYFDSLNGGSAEITYARWRAHGRQLERELNAAHARITQLEQALRELVRLKDLKERRDALYIKCKVAHDITAAETEELNRLTSEYTRCKPLAWQAARQALEHSAQAQNERPAEA